jgi:hypothetical protein
MQHDTTGQTQVGQAQPQRTSDFRLRPPDQQPVPAPAAPTQPPATTQSPSPPRTADQATTQSKPFNPVPPEGVTQTGMLIGGAILLVLAIVFLLISRSVRGHLIGRKASPSTAGSASWALFAFLLAVAATSVFGVLGDLWSVLAFIVPMGVLIAVTLVLCVVLFNSSRRLSH